MKERLESAKVIAITPESRTRTKNAKVHLTNTFVAKIEAPRRVARGTKKVKLPRPRYYDTEVAGLHIQVTHTGHKTWKFRYTNERGEKKTFLIGSFPRVKAENARRIAKEKLARVTLGEDVQRRKQQLREALTVEAFAKQYLSKRCTHLKSYYNLVSLFSGHIIPYFKKVKVPTITQELMGDFHQSMEDTPFLANRCKAVMHKMFKYAIEAKVMEHNPASGIKDFAEYRREGWFKNKSLEELIFALDLHSKKYPLQTLFFKLMMSTGRRPNEIYRLKWSQLDLTEKQMTQTTKTGDKVFPISDLTVELLRECQRYSGNYIYVFSKMAMNDIIKKSETPTDTYWKTYKWHWERIRARLVSGLGKKFTTYHLRHSFGSHMLKANKNIYNVKEAMGHASVKTTERYMHVLDEDIRKEIENTEALKI